MKAKLAVGAAALVALGLGSVGLYLGLKQSKAASKPGLTTKYVLAQNTTNGLMSLAYSDPSACTYTESSFKESPVPMPHQAIFCQGGTYCNTEYMIVSIYDYQYYLQNFETLLTYENNGIDFSDIHSLSQGKYVTAGISESKPDQSKVQEAEKNLASYAK